MWAIHHMEFHPTLGKPKTGPEVRLKRSSQKSEELKSETYEVYIKDLTDEDVRMLNQIVQLLDTQYLNKTIKVMRRKRFGLTSWVMGWGFLQTYRSIKTIKDNIRTLQEENLLQQDQIIELTHYLNITYGHVSSNRYAITNLQVRMAEVNKTLIAALSDVKFVKYSVAIINDIRIILAKLTLGVMSLEQNMNATYEYLRVLLSKQVNPLIIPPDSLRKVLAHVKEDMKRNPRLQLPEDPNINIWNYYSIMKVTPIVMDDFLLIILTIPLTDQSLEMDLYKIYNLPALHPKLKVEFTYQLEGEYLAITKNKLYAALQIRCLCLMNQALYPVEKIEWCAYALFTQNEDKKRAHCTINTQKRDANKAQSLEGYLWAVTTLKKEKMQIRCLTDTHVIDVKPPLTIIHVGNGCEAYSSNLFIPAKSELTSKDNAVVRYTYFQQFNEDYQNITRYSLIEDLGLVKLTKKEIENLPDRLTALPNLQFKELKRRLVEIKKSFNIHSNITFILFVVGGLILCPIIAYVLWQIYSVHSRVKSLKPITKLFSEQKGEIFNISDIVSNRLHTLEGQLTSLMNTINNVTGTELALPSTSGKPTPLPRRDSIPMLELSVTQQTIQETVKDMDRQGSKIRRYKKYLQKQAAEDQK